jgi:hypothetical protein
MFRAIKLYLYRRIFGNPNMPIIVNPKESLVYLEYKVDTKYFKWYDKILAYFINNPQPLYTISNIGQRTNDVVKLLVNKAINDTKYVPISYKIEKLFLTKFPLIKLTDEQYTKVVNEFKDKLKTLQDVEDYNNYLAKYVVNKYLLTKYTPQDLYYINTNDNLCGTTVNKERAKFLQSEFSGCATVL